MSRVPEPSNIPKLLDRIEKLQEAVSVARGTSGQLIKAAPLEIHLYNLTTEIKSILDGYHAQLEDALGIYMKDKK